MRRPKNEGCSRTIWPVFLEMRENSFQGRKTACPTAIPWVVKVYLIGNSKIARANPAAKIARAQERFKRGVLPPDPELVTVVREGDAVLMSGGYHPNVSVPGHRIGYLWAMAAHREKEDRRFGVFNVQPDFNHD